MLSKEENNQRLSLEEAEQRYYDVKELFFIVKQRYTAADTIRESGLREEDKKTLADNVNALTALRMEPAVQEEWRQSALNDRPLPLYHRATYLITAMLRYASPAFFQHP